MLHIFRNSTPRIGSQRLRVLHPRRDSRRRTKALLAVERMEERTLLSTFTVTNTNDSGDSSLRQAILDVNADAANSSADTIDFNIPGSGVHTIQPLSGLPIVTHPVFIDGYSQPGSKPNEQAASDDAVLLIELDGSLAGAGSYGLALGAGSSTVRGLVINEFSSTGIFVESGATHVAIQGNFIGTDPTGEQSLGNSADIGFYQSDYGLVGTNGDGVDDLAERNIISGSVNSGAGAGVGISASHCVVAGNFIGTDALGTHALGNAAVGVAVTGDCNRIGADGHDADPTAERNIISGNGGGVVLEGFGQNVVAGNFIGTDVTGTNPLGNGKPNMGFVVTGVTVLGSDGNCIGTDGDGVGDAAERNIISANLGNAVGIGGNNNVVAGNFIGTDITGTKTLGNLFWGVWMSYGGSSNRVGTDGQSADNIGERNVIANNPDGGVGIWNTQGNDLVAGNWIGVGSDGSPMGNGDGVSMEGDSSDQVGGSPALANLIAYNLGRGVTVIGSSIDDSIRCNAIYNNQMGIDLGNDWDTPNDPGDIDMGPNNLQNFPVLSTASSAGPTTTVIGTLNSAPDTTYTIDFYANDSNKGGSGSHGQGQYYLGKTVVRTDESGNAIINEPGLAATSPGEWVTATATDPAGNTSEFAFDVQAVPAKLATTTTLTPSATSPLGGDSVTFAATVSGTLPGSGTPSGYVDFFDTTTNRDLGTVNLSASAAVLRGIYLAVGSHTIIATYNGDSNFQPSSATTTVNVLAHATLCGTVFADFNNDGYVDLGELGIPGVAILLTGTDDLGAVSRSQVTDADGTYVFPNLRPGTYTITEDQQPLGFAPGINTVGTAGGNVSGSQFTGINLAAGENGLNYNYGERPTATAPVRSGQTAGIGFWNNSQGQALIKELNGGAGTRLGDWLAASFPNMFGASSGSNDLARQDNAYVASFFQSRFVVHSQKLDAQVLATALAVYVTDSALDSTGVGAQYGFTVGGNGVATATFNVGSNGAAFGAADNTVVTVMDLLLAADAQANNGVLYNGDSTKRTMANNVFSAINQAGGI